MISALSKKQAIRLNNTLLAAAGGLVLSVVMFFSFSRGDIIISGAAFTALAVVFWLGNVGFILGIFFGFNLRFKDPALSMPQMVWAACISMGAVAISVNIETAVYSLILLTMLFGVFRVSVTAFNTYCTFVIAGLGIIHAWRVWGIHSVESSFVVWVGWFTFSFCAVGLTLLCKSILKLRNRLRAQNEELKHALQAKSYFLANMSHEIRTPMNGVLGMLEIALRGDLPSEQRQHLGIAQSSANALLRVINDILDFSKIEAGKLVLDAIPVHLETLITEVVSAFAAPAQQKDLELIVDISPQLPPCVLIDPTRVRQIINNLLGNALKFTEQGEVVVAVFAEPANNSNAEGEPKASMADELENNKAVALNPHRIKLNFVVKDTGIGIAKEKCDELFDSFTQADISTTRTYGGTGLGLAITKQLCVLMGGDISVTSEEGKGSTFSAVVKAELAQECEQPEPVNTTFIGKVFLVVDDNATNRLILRNQLVFKGATVYEASSAIEALDVLRDKGQYVDLAILDMHMPIMDGMALAHAIRAEQQWNAMKLVMLTSVIIDVPKAQLSALSIAAYLNKPIISYALYSALSNVFNGFELDVYSTQQQNDIARLADTEQNKNYKLLLVEDNPTNQEVALVTLDGLGYYADVAENGEVGIQKMREAQAIGEPYQLVLMDCQMPVMDGYTATRKIRQLTDEGISKTIIIALTAHAMEGDREKCLNAGMDDYITKPINIELLSHTLKHWLAPQVDVPLDDAWLESEEHAAVDDWTSVDDCTPVESCAHIEDTVTEQESFNAQELVWDKEALYTLVRKKQERMVRLVSVFVVDLNLAWGNIDSIRLQQDADALQKALHSLKGASSNLGARALPATLKKVERLIKELPPESLWVSDVFVALLEDIQSEIVELSKEMTEFLAVSPTQDG